jgi:hypothetical protein
MARSSEQSDFTFDSPPPDDAATTEAKSGSVFASKWLLRITLIMLVALALLCAIGPHIPAGG